MESCVAIVLIVSTVGVGEVPIVDGSRRNMLSEESGVRSEFFTFELEALIFKSTCTPQPKTFRGF